MGVHFGSLGNHFGASFLWIQKATLRRRHPSFTAIVFECSEEVRFESLGSNFGANFLWVQKATLGTTSCRPNKIIHPQPLGSAAGGVAPFYIYILYIIYIIYYIYVYIYHLIPSNPSASRGSHQPTGPSAPLLSSFPPAFSLARLA